MGQELEKEMELARIEESAAAVDALFVSSVHLPQTDPSDTSPLPSIWQRGAFSEVILRS